MTLTPEQLKALMGSFTQARLNASTPAERESAEMMCEVVRLAEVGQVSEKAVEHFKAMRETMQEMTGLEPYRGDVD